ncbi:MAG: hypothetical protein H0T79_08035, partial [Deltaproteobacteria bacterium]|nr:hypothetical protein [Deltaproteobacteria bacterium]
MFVVGVIVLSGACGAKAQDPGPDLQIVGESTRLRMNDPLPRTTPWFDGNRVTLVAARGETLGIQVVNRPGGSITLAIANARVQGFAVESLVARRGSTLMYGATQGAGRYPD